MNEEMWRKNKANNSSTRNISKCENNDNNSNHNKAFNNRKKDNKNNGCSNSNNYNINDLKDEQNDRLEMKETLT